MNGWILLLLSAGFAVLCLLTGALWRRVRRLEQQAGRRAEQPAAEDDRTKQAVRMARQWDNMMRYAGSDMPPAEGEE